MFDVPTSIPNLNPELVSTIESKLFIKLDWDAPVGISLAPNKSSINNGINGLGLFTPTDLLDYIYAVLHSQTYRETYKEFLKIDFPSVPFGEEWMKLVGKQTDIITEFWRLVGIGGQLRKIHLLEIPDTLTTHVGYPVAGSNEIMKIYFDGERVFINENQYFSNVNASSWSFYIGGYQPAQKWLKDRKGRVLESEEIRYYSHIIDALDQTDILMKTVDR
jgi:Type ISP C-terminal specificity domain